MVGVWMCVVCGRQMMKQKVKINQYSVYGKKRLYEILVFPAEKYMWACDPYPGEDFYMIDGNRQALRNLAIAFAILAANPFKIIYFPIKKVKGKEYFWDSFQLVLLRPELQFRRSEWFRLKGRLDKKHWTGKYVFSYDAQKLDDYYKRISRQWNYPELTKQEEKYCVEEILGDVMFWVVPKNKCYFYHSRLDDVISRQDDTAKLQWWDSGYLDSEWWIEELEEQMREEN